MRILFCFPPLLKIFVLGGMMGVRQHVGSCSDFSCREEAKLGAKFVSRHSGCASKGVEPAGGCILLAEFGGAGGGSAPPAAQVPAAGTGREVWRSCEKERSACLALTYISSGSIW